MELIRCPHCGQAYFTVMYSICTAIAWQPIYKNGRLMNKNPNYITDFCYCLNCKQEFSVRIGGNENEEIDVEKQALRADRRRSVLFDIFLNLQYNYRVKGEL